MCPQEAENLFYFACNLYVLSASMTQISSRSLSNYIRMRSIYIREILSLAYLHTISLHCLTIISRIKMYQENDKLRTCCRAAFVTKLQKNHFLIVSFFSLNFVCQQLTLLSERERSQEKYVKTIRANAHRI